MGQGGGVPILDDTLVYSIQKTYIIKPVSNSEKHILTCDERIDIPTIEPLSHVQVAPVPNTAFTVVPCIQLAGEFLDEFNLTLETNEGVTVLPLKLDLLDNPYVEPRYVLVLPRGATGVKSCKLIKKATGKEVQHNFTFGIMPPPYNYENYLFSIFNVMFYMNNSSLERMYDRLNKLEDRVIDLENKVNA